MLEKQQQFKIAKKRIAQQSWEFISECGLNPQSITRKKRELIEHAEKEINYWGDMKETSSCWSLVHWVSNLTTKLVLNFNNFKEEEKRSSKHV